MRTLWVLFKNFLKGIVVGSPLLVLVVVSELIIMTHTGYFETKNLMQAVYICGVYIGEIVFNVISVITLELPRSIFHDLKGIVKFFQKIFGKKTAK